MCKLSNEHALSLSLTYTHRRHVLSLSYIHTKSLRPRHTQRIACRVKFRFGKIFNDSCSCLPKRTLFVNPTLKSTTETLE